MATDRKIRLFFK